jgi:hypothetical protein
MQTSTLRPGLLVSLKTTITGNVKYDRQDIEPEHMTTDGAQVAKWETERTIMDPAEHDAAVKARSKARSIVTGVCAKSYFGLLCPEANAVKLEEAVAEARKVAKAFNDEAKLTRVNVYLMTGRVAPDDVEAIKAINSEIRDLMAKMQTGIANCDVKVIREAANKAKSVGTMLSVEATERIKDAIDVARKAARQIVQSGDTAAQEVDRVAIQTITAARTAFLDMDMDSAVAAPVTGDGRALDLMTEPKVEKPKPGRFRLELGE